MPISSAQVHSVDHVTVLLWTDSSVEHCEPEADSPQRLVNREYEPDVIVSNWPQAAVLARRSRGEAETSGRSKRSAGQEIIANE